MEEDQKGGTENNLHSLKWQMWCSLNGRFTLSQYNITWPGKAASEIVPIKSGGAPPTTLASDHQSTGPFHLQA